MSVTIIALILVIIIILGITTEIVCNRYIKKITNTYWFWFGISLFLLAWYIGFRFSFQWRTLAENWSTLDTSTLRGSFLFAKGFILDLCPFFSLMVPILLIVDPTRKAASLAAPILVVAASVVVFGQFWGSISPDLTVLGFFTGLDMPSDCKLYEFIHMANLFLGIGIILNSPKLHWKGYLATFAVVGAFLLYVGICMAASGTHFTVTGLSIDDWIKHPGIPDPDYDPPHDYVGQYYFITELVGGNPYLAMGLFYPVGGLLIFGFLYLMDFVKSKKWLRYGNAKTNCWWKHYDYNKFVCNKFI